MPLSLTQHALEKIESLLKAMDYKVRYEKGNFRTGACLLENSKVIVVNKFVNLESKIIALAELIKTINTDETVLDEKQKQLFYSLKQTKAEL